jgi:hypothetical protein
MNSNAQEAPAAGDLACELSFAAFASQQHSHRSCCGHTSEVVSRRASVDSEGGSEAAAAEACGGDDQVLFDDELASYISDTDYAELAEEGLEVSLSCYSCLW